jgi:hypothetical protein
MKYIKILIRFLKTWHELWMLPLALTLYFLAVPLVQLIDPTAGVFDMGYLLALIMTAVYFLWFHGLTWLLFKLSWPELYGNITKWVKEFTTEGTLWQKVLLSVFVWCFYLFLLVLLLLAL